MDSTNPAPPSTHRGISWRLTLLLLLLPTAGACFTYTEVGIESVAPGQPVRVRVFEQAIDRLPAELERRMQVEGTVVDLDDGRLNLLPELGVASTDPVSLALSDIQAVSRRELNRTRTWLGAALGAALGVGILLAIEGEPAATGGPGPITGFMLGSSLPLGR